MNKFRIMVANKGDLTKWENQMNIEISGDEPCEEVISEILELLNQNQLRECKFKLESEWVSGTGFLSMNTITSD